jgi:hypothetical protein
LDEPHFADSMTIPFRHLQMRHKREK